MDIKDVHRKFGEILLSESAPEARTPNRRGFSSSLKGDRSYLNTVDIITQFSCLGHDVRLFQEPRARGGRYILDFLDNDGNVLRLPANQDSAWEVVFIDNDPSESEIQRILPLHESITKYILDLKGDMWPKPTSYPMYYFLIKD